MTCLSGGPHDIINQQAQQAKLVVGVSILCLLFDNSAPCINTGFPSAALQESRKLKEGSLLDRLTMTPKERRLKQRQ